MKNKETKFLELYIHIPFCVKKCDYCDFLSGPAGEEEQEAYVKALLAEIAALSETSDEKFNEVSDGTSGKTSDKVLNRPLSTIFIGGGTPSAIDASLIAEIMDNLKKRFTISPEAEISMEANPGTLTREKLAVYKACGINRLSLGLQSAKNEELKILGRIHTWEEFLESYALARDAGFSNINVDLMSAIPTQTYENWIENLRKAASLGPEHISAYSLIVEEGTPFAQRELDLPDEDTEYRMYEDTAAVLKEYGYKQYEISNYAKPGFACQHNIGYWKRRDYLGIGLGAASLYEDQRFSNTRDMAEYLAYSADVKRIRKERIVLSKRDKMEEFMFLGLRMTEGISEAEFQKQFEKALPEVYGKVLYKYEKMGFLEYENGFWRFTRTGIHVSNQILADFLE